MSLLPTVLQSQTTYAIDAVQESNSAYYFALQGEGGGGTGNTVNAPFTVIADEEGVPSGDILIQTDGSIDGYINVGDASGTYSFFQAGSGGGNGIIQLGDTRGYWTDILNVPEGFSVSVVDGTNVEPTQTILNYATATQSLTLCSPTFIDTEDASSGIVNGIVIPADNTNAFAYGVVISDVNAAGENMAALVSEGDAATLQLGNSGAANAYFVASPTGMVIGNTDSDGTATPMISWTPDEPTLTLSLNNPVQIVGSSGAGIPYDTVYNPLPAPTLPIITSPTAPIILAQWANTLAPEGSTPYSVTATGLYLVTASVRISTGVAYSFPAGSILNLTPSVSGTQDPYNSMTFFLSSTGPQGNINTTQSGLGFYVQGDTIVGTLNQASTGSINLGDSGGITMYIQQVINQNP